jgi:hypothetical protein
LPAISGLHDDELSRAHTHVGGGVQHGASARSRRASMSGGGHRHRSPADNELAAQQHAGMAVVIHANSPAGTPAVTSSQAIMCTHIYKPWRSIS